MSRNPGDAVPTREVVLTVVLWLGFGLFLLGLAVVGILFIGEVAKGTF